MSQLQRVPAPFRRSWHPLSYSHKADIQRKSARLRVCSSKPEDSEEEKKSRPESRNNKILKRLQAQLKDNQENSSTPEAASKEKEAVGLTMALSFASYGTAAVVAGYLLHLDPYGHFHWSSRDALIGLACAVPLAAADFGLMIPDFSTTPNPLKNLPGFNSLVSEQATQAKDATEKLLQSDEMQSRFQQALQSRDEERDGAAAQDSRSDAMQALQEAAQHSARQGQPAEGATASTSQSSDADQQNKEQSADQPSQFKAELLDKLKASLPPDQNVFTEALDQWQRQAVFSNPGRAFVPPVEVAIIVLVHFVEEMLFRAVILQGLSLWVTDRLYEANAEEVISGIGDNGMSVPDAGKWTALAVCIGLQLGWAVRGLLSPSHVRIEAKEASGQSNLEPPTIESAAKKRKDMEQLLSHVQKKVSKQMKARLVVDTARGSLSAAALGSSFILTGNLLAPYLASVSCDLLFSYYQRSKFQELKQRMEQRVTKMMGGLQDMAAASTKFKEAVTKSGDESSEK